MISYTVNFPNLPSNLTNVKREEFLNENLGSLIQNQMPLINYNFMVNLYGFELSKEEIDQFKCHYLIWQKFADSEHLVCLIMESDCKLSSSLKKIGEQVRALIVKYPDCDLLFPFEKCMPLSHEFEFGYLLGYKWGAKKYFLTKSGVLKLLGLKEIRQPVDEEILWMSTEGKLTVYNKDLGLFKETSNDLISKSRALSIKRAVFNLEAWTSENKNSAISLLNIVNDQARFKNIDLWVCYGSALGFVRHGCIMPWDDDIDLCIREDKYDVFIKALKQVDGIGFDIFHFGRDKIPYCKIWFTEKPKIANYTYSFPFIDVWFYNDTNEGVVFKDNKRYEFSSIYPLQEILFEGTAMKIASNPLRYLDETYSDWRTKIRVYPWSHRLENESFPPLSLDISVDYEGQYLY